MLGRYPRPERRAAPSARNAGVAFAVLLSACSSEQAGRPVGPPSSVPAASSAATPLARAYGPAWEAAERSADEADLVRLALAEGATGLLGAIDDPAHRGVALRALPHAPDRDLAIEPLARRVQDAGPDAATFADGLLGVLAPPGEDRERLDPDGERAAARVLLGVAADEKAPRALRAKATTALWRLAERGVLPRDEVPALAD